MGLHEHAWVPNARGSLSCRCDAWMPAPPASTDVAITT